MIFHPSTLVITLIGFLAAGTLAGEMARADVQILLPLQGYFRPGHYMPVLVQAEPGATRTLTLSGEGLVPTAITFDGPTVAPVLVLSAAASEVTDGRSGLPLRELRAEEALVGFLGPARPALEQFFPGRRLVPVQLGEEFAASSPLLWDALHAVCFERAADADPRAMGELLAMGITLIVLGERAPDDVWPWEQAAGGWLLRSNLPGPSTAIVGEAAYLPTLNWRPGAPPTTRHNVVIGGVVVSILVLACVLFRRAAVGVAALALTTVVICAVLAFATARQSPVKRMAGTVEATQRHMHQHDAWLYFTSHQAAEERHVLSTGVRPMLADPRQAGALDLRIHWSESGPREVLFQLRDGLRFGVLHRTVSTVDLVDLPRPEDLAPPVAGDPFLLLARRLYVRDDWRIAGQAGRGEVRLTRP
jgi:hypothetical protein